MPKINRVAIENYQSIERVVSWDQVPDVTGNRHFADLDPLEGALPGALRRCWETPARAGSLVQHWLHSQANAIAGLRLPEPIEK